MRNDEQYLQQLKLLYKEHFKKSAEKEECCQFKEKSGDKWCKATSHKTCKRCKMFTPTTQTMIRTVVVKTEELLLEIEAKKAIIREKHAENDKLLKRIKQKDQKIKILKDEIKELKKRNDIGGKIQTS